MNFRETKRAFGQTRKKKKKKKKKEKFRVIVICLLSIPKNKLSASGIIRTCAIFACVGRIFFFFFFFFLLLLAVWTLLGAFDRASSSSANRF
jgi:hypothetical protein